MLSIHNLTAKIENKIILNSINLDIQAGQTISLIGHNGSGKSSLAQIISGNRDYENSEESKILYNDKNILELEPHEVARLGIFVSFQNPVDVPNVPILSFLKLISDESRIAKGLIKYSAKEFMVQTRINLKMLNWDESWLKRNLNEGMSGGEKKKCEILQLLTLNPNLIILDEIDSGLDERSLESIGKILQKLQQSNKTLMIITHNKKILDYLRIDRQIEMEGGEFLN
jgi:Fe-S cluster assembly ATP-binding protein